ncbi:unnamed protein product [Lactuca virosa]|uniref:E3 SUMO-protein ligase SIZ1 n=1 Tax=Lactuca virosa TaxID=75947 RepID=A0AAU9NUK8_9ASTR|nr:unnamed protein product [Lactuca virosa]
MDLVASCKEKMAHFRIRELKDILTQLGLSKQGKKQDLTDRISAVLSDERVSGMWSKKNAVGKEEVAKLVDDIYRKMQDSGATDLASKGRAVLDATNSTKPKEEIEDVLQNMEKVRCPCGSSLQADSMIKCEDPRCHVWQHINCVIIPEKPLEGILPAPPPKFYCELCRLGRADPFLLSVAHPLPPVQLIIANPPTDGANPVQSVEKTFQLTRVDRDLLVKPEYDVQAWCMLLNDKVSFRMQWPQYAELQINGVPMRATNRPGAQLLGANGRDDGPIITPCTRDGINKISLTGCDSRVFCLGVRIIKRRTVQQILNLIPKESDGERFEDALARVRRCVGGGAPTENADSDSDLEVVSDSIPVNLRCPMSGSRMKIAGRFKPCAHMGCFDLEVFVEMNQRSRKWQCPICLKNYALENVIIDPYFTLITSKMRNCGEDVTEIEVKPDGSWRAKSEDDRKSLGELGQWHLPDGTLCVGVPMEVDSKPKLEALKQVKQEGLTGSEGHTRGLKLGMKKNKNGFWEVRKPDNLNSLSSGSKLPENFINNNGHGIGNNTTTTHNNVIPMSSSATGSGGDDTSVNQDGGGQFDYSTPNGVDLDSLSLNIHGFVNPGDADVIVLSDSEDEAEAMAVADTVVTHNDNLLSSSAQIGFPNLPLHSHPEDPSSLPLGLFNDDFGAPFWSVPSNNNHGVGPSFQLFGSDADPTDNGPLGGFTLGGETSMGGPTALGADDGLVDNPLAAYGGDDPSLQLFLPTKPLEATTEHVEVTRQQSMSSNGFRSDDWISLSLGGGGGGGGVRCEPDPGVNGLNSRQKAPLKDGTLDSLADTASLLLGMSDGRSEKSSREREGSDSPFLFPRQKRSVRPRLFLSIDSDSEEEG